MSVPRLDGKISTDRLAMRGAAAGDVAQWDGQRFVPYAIPPAVVVPGSIIGYAEVYAEWSAPLTNSGTFVNATTATLYNPQGTHGVAAVDVGGVPHIVQASDDEPSIYSINAYATLSSVTGGAGSVHQLDFEGMSALGATVAMPFVLASGVYVADLTVAGQGYIGGGGVEPAKARFISTSGSLVTYTDLSITWYITRFTVPE